MPWSVIVGGSAGLGAALARQMGAKGHDLILIARDPNALETEAIHIQLQYSVRVECLALDLTSLDPSTLHAFVASKAGHFDHLFLVAGFGLDGDDGTLDPATQASLIALNFTGPIQVISCLRDLYSSSPERSLVVISSIAAARARAANLTYAAAKRGLEFYLEGIKHGCGDAAPWCQVYRVGFMDTTLMRVAKGGLLLSRPMQVAESIAARIGKGHQFGYLPKRWALIMAVFCALPWFIFKHYKG